MKITLRKASVLQNEIQEAIKNLTFTGQIQLNEFQDARSSLAAAKELLLGNLTKADNLSNALGAVRSLVGKANVTTGVHAKLAELAVVDKMISRYTELAVDANKFVDISMVEAKVVKLGKQTESRSYYGSESVASGVLSDADIESFKDEIRDLRKRKQRINDEILEANIRTEIELSVEIVAILTDSKII